MIETGYKVACGVVLVALVAAGIVSILVFALGDVQLSGIGASVNDVLVYCGDALKWGRQFFNYFLDPLAIPVLSAFLSYVVMRPLVLPLIGFVQKMILKAMGSGQ